MAALTQQEIRADVVILGGGPGGYTCALRAADLGLTVALVEAAELGGTCLNRGCVPTRALLQAAAAADTVRVGARRWGITAALQAVDPPAMRAACDTIVTRTRRAVEHQLTAARVRILPGTARVTGPRTVVLDGTGEAVRADRALVLATGSVPRTLPGTDPDGQRVLTSAQALTLERIPRSAIVLGSGAVGVEFAQVWHGLGARVVLVEARDRLVPGEDPDLGRELGRVLRRRGIDVRVGTRATAVEDAGHGVRVTLERDGSVVEERADIALVAVGRRPRSGGLGFERAGVTVEDGWVVPGDWRRLETSQPGVFAVGDLLPPPSLARANAALAEGALVAEVIAGRPTRRIDYTGVSRITHGIVETAAVGMSEDQARRGGEVRVTRMPIGAVVKGLLLGEGGMAKVVTRPGGAVLGVHLVGPGVSELVGEAMLMTGFEAAAHDVLPLVHPHPTLSEVLSESMARLVHGVA